MHCVRKFEKYIFVFVAWSAIDRERVSYLYRLQVYNMGHVVNKYNRRERLLPLAKDKHDYHSRRDWGGWKKATEQAHTNRRKEGGGGGKGDLGCDRCTINECGEG